MTAHDPSVYIDLFVGDDTPIVATPGGHIRIGGGNTGLTLFAEPSAHPGSLAEVVARFCRRLATAADEVVGQAEWQATV